MKKNETITTTTVTPSDIRKYIDGQMERWLFGNFAKFHMNATHAELRARIGKYNDAGRLILRTSTFVDNGTGDAIVHGIADGIKWYAATILGWLLDDSAVGPLVLHFNHMPQGVVGYVCSAFDGKVKASDGYNVVLEKGDTRFEFYMRNAYPFATKACA